MQNIDISAVKKNFRIIGNDNKLNEAVSIAVRVAPTDSTIVITGESGVGKDVFARIIHQNSRRKQNNYVAVNCAAIPEGTIESELFGHIKGSFTGADKDRKGYFAEADKGTIFLDEIGDMSLRMQVKLLRVLQEGRITRVGGRGEIPVNVRVIIATHVDMPSLVEKGLFREDLYYRLMGLTINIPCLAERDNDVLLLAETFINDFCLKNKKPLCFLSESAKKALLTYNFPGNVRELKSIIELAVVLSKDNIIKLEDLSFRDKCDKKQDFFAIERTMEEYESLIIKYFMNKYDNRVRLVADKLNISKTKIYKLLQDEKI